MTTLLDKQQVSQLAHAAKRAKQTEVFALVMRDRALAADARLVAVRDQVAKAALACLRQRPDATAQVRLALGLVEQARAELAHLQERDDA